MTKKKSSNEGTPFCDFDCHYLTRIFSRRLSVAAIRFVVSRWLAFVLSCPVLFSCLAFFLAAIIPRAFAHQKGRGWRRTRRTSCSRT